MMRSIIIIPLLFAGCSHVTEVRGRINQGTEYWKLGGPVIGSDTRAFIQPGVQVTWDNGWTTSVDYQYQVSDFMDLDSIQGVYFGVSFPIWRKPPCAAKE